VGNGIPSLHLLERNIQMQFRIRFLPANQFAFFVCLFHPSYKKSNMYIPANTSEIAKD
jgi:hypothetical protein